MAFRPRISIRYITAFVLFIAVILAAGDSRSGGLSKTGKKYPHPLGHRHSRNAYSRWLVRHSITVLAALLEAASRTPLEEATRLRIQNRICGRPLRVCIP